MRKIALILAGTSVLAAGAWFACNPCTGGNQDEIPAEKRAYTELFNQRTAEIMQFNRQKGEPKNSQSPDQFYLFDKLKRMNPATGEVPADGLSKAWKQLVQMFGAAEMTGQKNTNYGLQWEERGPTNIGGRTRAAMFDPNDATHKACFAGGVGGSLWRTNDITVTSPVWVNVSPTYSNVAITCIGYDPTNPQILYYGTGEGYNNADALRGEGLWKSTDGGTTWNQLAATAIPSFYYCHKIAVAPNGDLYVATKSGLFKSIDKGSTFYKVLGQGTGMGNDWMTDIEIAGDGDIYVGSSGSGIYRSPISLGATQGELGSWTRLSVNLGSGYSRIELAVGQAQPNILWAVAEISNATGNIYRSTNDGVSWAATTSQPNNGNDYSNGQAWYDLSFETNPTNANELFTGGLHIYRTTDAGASWSRRTSGGGGSLPYVHVDQHGIFYRPGNPSNILFTNDGGLWLTTDGGTNFANKNTGYNVTQFYSLSVDPRPAADIIIGGTQDNGSMLVSGSGINPAMGLTGADGSFCAIDHQRPDTMYTTYQYQTVLRSRDGGNNFTNITNPNISQSDVMFINPLEIDANDANLLFQAGRALYRHNNAGSGSGSGWVQATRSFNTAITAIASAPSQPYLTYLAAGGTVYRLPFANTTNSSTNPTAVNAGGNGSGYISCIAVNPNDPNHIVLTYSSYGVSWRVVECRNADQGTAAVWRSITGNLPDMPINWAVFEPNSTRGLIVGTDLGAFRCPDIDQPSNTIWWNPERIGMGCPRIDMLEVRAADKSVHAATHGRGFFSTYSYNQVPSANFGNSTDSVCGGFVQFIDSSSNVPNTWFWDFGDGGTSTTANPVHQYAASGTYTVQMIVSNPNGSDTLTRSIQVVVLPDVVPNAGPDISVCAGDTLQLQATGGVTYSWFPTAGLDDPNIANPKYYVNGSRTYVVTVTNASGCVGLDTIVVTALARPNVWAGTDQTIANVNDTAQLGATGAITYSWSPATGLSCTNCPDPKAYPSVTTTYTVTGTAANGCSKSDQVIVNVVPVSIDDALNQAGAQFLSLSPNPFPQNTELTFQLAKSAEVKFEAFNLAGKRVAVATLGRKEAGDHSYTWHAQDLPNGLYYIALTVDGYKMVRKAVLQR